jgi:hypothetical protein
MSIQGNPFIIHDSSLVLSLDAANPKSYIGSGTNWIDLSGNTNATLVGTPTFSSAALGSFTLNGSSQYATVSNVYNFATSNQLTAIVWAKSAVSTWNDYGFLISKRDQFVMHPAISTRDVNYYFNTTFGWQATSYTVPDITVFAQYAMSYNAGTINGYHNGIRVAGASIGTTLSSDTGVVEIGKDDTLARYLNGSIAKVELYNRQLSNEEVLQNYNATRTRFGL